MNEAEKQDGQIVYLGQKYHVPKVTCGIFRFLYMSLFREMTV